MNLENMLDRNPELFAKKQPKVLRGTGPNNTKGQKPKALDVPKMSIRQAWNFEQG